MSDNEEVKEEAEEKVTAPGQGGNKKRFTKIILICSACVLVIALAVLIGLFVGKPESVARIIDFGTALKGVSIGEVDISGMSKDQALEATAGLEGSILSNINFTLDVNGEAHEYTAEDFNVITDYQDAISKALNYGHTGTFEERKEAADKASSEGVQFPVTPYVDKEKLQVSLATLKQELDKVPQDASPAFMPWGYTSDNKEYQPDIRAMVDAYSVGHEYARPNLIRTDAADKPNPLRYKFWENSKYRPDYIPADADISRFLYTPDVTGIATDTDSIFCQIVDEVKNGSYPTIMVPFQLTEPTVKLAAVKNNTQLIVSWTSSFSKPSHYNSRRNWNVARMSAFINGNVIIPGQSWSVNDTAGLRNAQTARTIGWKEAGGIENGGYTSQYGGGVCQLGSTTYNAAIRSGITIALSNHHSIPSDYIPLGLDATLNSKPNLDLVLKNDGTVPYYLISYVNPKDKNVTVEVYGPLPRDPKYGPVIYDYTFKNLGRFGTPGSRTVYNTIVAPDDTVLSPENPVYVYAKARAGTVVQTYRHILALDGKELSVEPYTYWRYRPIDGTTYVYGDGTTPEPTPTP